MQLKVIDNSKVVPQEYNFDEQHFDIFYTFEHINAQTFEIKIETRFENELFETTLENFSENVQSSTNLEAELYLNGILYKKRNIKFKRYVLENTETGFGGQILREQVYFQCL